MYFFKIFLPTLIFCFILDFLWIGFFGKEFYMQAIGPLLRSPNNEVVGFQHALSAIFVYILLVAGLLIFVLPRVLENYWSAFLWGALYGFLIYGIYNFTNYAMLANWPFKVNIVDIIWGLILNGITTVFARFLYNYFYR